MKVYVLTEGDYSDYRILGVYSSRENAERAGQYLKCGDIEEYPMDTFLTEFDSNLFPYNVQMRKNGDVLRVDRYRMPSTGHAVSDMWFSGDNNILILQCFARDDEHAIKITNEKRTQVIALGMWGRNP